jgi:hypothetical protein
MPRNGQAREFRRTRWLYQKDGRDLGPFRPHEIRQLLESGDIAGTTRVRESAQTEWHEVREVKVFVEYLQEIKEQSVVKAKERELDKELDRVRSKRRAPLAAGLVVLLLLVAVGVWYGWLRYQDGQTAADAGVTSRLYRNLELPNLAITDHLQTGSEIEWADEQVKVRNAKDHKARAAKKNVAKKRGPRMVKTSDDLASEKVAVRDISFGGDDGEAAGRDLMPGEITSVRSRAVPRLVKCATAEANRVADFPGTTVSFKLQTSGKLGAVKAGQNGRRSKSFMACIRGALGGISIQPFGGHARTVRVPLQVGR